VNAAAQILLKQLKSLQERYEFTQSEMDKLSEHIDGLIKEKNILVTSIQEIQIAIEILSKEVSPTVKKKGKK
jgi:chromosome segregation ATPase